MHKKRYSSLIVILILGISITTSFFSTIGISQNKDIYVKSGYFGFSDGTADKPYKTIQAALDVAVDGDTIYVFSGVYPETLVITKQLHLRGAIDEEESIIQTIDDIRYTVEIRKDFVVFEGFTLNDEQTKKTSPIGALVAVTNNANNVVVSNNFFNNTLSFAIYIDQGCSGSIIVNNDIDSVGGGIRVSESHTHDILENTITNCLMTSGIVGAGYGIYLQNSINTRLFRNVLESNKVGAIYASKTTGLNVTDNFFEYNSQGIHIQDSSTCQIRNNSFHNNTGNAIYLDSSNDNVFENMFYYNQRGIYLLASYSRIYNNRFSNQDGSGIMTSGSSHSNVIYQNKFIENGKSAEDNGNNQWHFAEKGNYWWDYDYIDADLDKIGDKPYTAHGVYDPYPLGYFLKPPVKPYDPSPEDGEDGVGLNIKFEVTVDDEDSDQLTVYFYRYREDGDDFLFGTAKRIQAGDTASVNYRQPFNTIFVWYVVACDGLLQNTSDFWVFTTAATPPDNKPPVANIYAPYIAAFGSVIEFDGSESYDPDGTIAYYRWNFGDESSEILAQNPNHLYENPGTYEVVLTVIDNHGTSATTNKTIIISEDLSPPNQPPKSIITGSYTAKTGESLTFDGSDSYDPDGIILSYIWHFGDGSTGNGMTPTHTYEKEGSYIVSLTVTDDEGETDTTTIFIEIEKSSFLGIPGFELLLGIIALLGLIGFIRYNKKR